MQADTGPRMMARINTRPRDLDGEDPDAEGPTMEGVVDRINFVGRLRVDRKYACIF